MGRKNVEIIRDKLLDMILTVLIYGFFLWASVNLVFIAFHIGMHMTYLQGISIVFLTDVLYSIAGGGRS